MKVLQQIRENLKLLLYNSCTDSVESTATAAAANIAAIRALSLKVPRLFAKLPLLELLSANSTATYASTMLLLLLIKELSIFFGQDVIRNRLKMSLPARAATTTGESAAAAVPAGKANKNPLSLPLQQCVMQYLQDKLSPEECVAFGSNNISSATTAPATTTAAMAMAMATSSSANAVSLSEEVDLLLKRTPLNRSHMEKGVTTKGGLQETTLPQQQQQQERQQHHEHEQQVSHCIAWFAAAITFIPFPVEETSYYLASSATPVGDGMTGAHSSMALVTEAAVKRLIEKQIEQDQFQVPIIQMLHRGNEEWRDSREMKHLETNLAISASVLRYLPSINPAVDNAISFSMLDYATGNEETQILSLVPLHDALLREIAVTVRMALRTAGTSNVGAAKAKDGLHVSAGFLIGLIIALFSTWHTEACKLLTGTYVATNVEESAQLMIQKRLFEQYGSFSQLLREFLGLIPNPVIGYDRNKFQTHPHYSNVIAELIGECKSLLTSLTSSLKHQDVNAFSLSEAYRNELALDISTLKSIGKYRAHCPIACAFSVCHALGSIVSLLCCLGSSALKTISSSTRTAGAEPGPGVSALAPVGLCASDSERTALTEGALAGEQAFMDKDVAALLGMIGQGSDSDEVVKVLTASVDDE